MCSMPETARPSTILPQWADEVPEHWQWLALSEACIAVVDCPHSTPELVDCGPYLMARTSDILTGTFRTEEARHVSRITYEERIRRAEPQEGDVLYSREGTYFGLSAEVPPETKVCLGQRMVLLRPEPSIVTAGFLKFWLNSPRIQSYIHGYRDGSVAERLNLTTIRRLPVCTPPLGEQQTIAHILGTLDDKIELNRRMNQTLEAVARAIFKSWFIDFDPVHAKAEGREPVGMDPGTAALFPDSFQDSPLGKIPKGWEIGTAGDLAALSRDGLKPGDFSDELFEHYSIPAYDKGRIPKVEPGEAIKSNKLFVLPNCVLLSKLNPRIPRVWLPALHDSRRSVSSTEFLVVIPKFGLSRELLYSMFSRDAFMSEFATLVTGTSGSHQRVKPDALLNLGIVVPPLPLVQHFTVAVSGLLDRVAENRAQSRTLVTLRDTLLPQLISGELPVKDVAHIVLEANV